MNASNFQKRNEKELIEQTINDLKKREGVRAVMLFGSYVRGEQKPISDIDICVLTKKNISNKTKAEIGSYASRKIDISLFWDLPPAVKYAVLKEGRTLFSKDEEFMHVVTVETMSEYLDFKHIIDRNITRVFGK